MTALFDSLSHPTLTGKWPGSSKDASFAALAGALAQNGFRLGCAVGVAGVEGYEHQRFLSACRDFPSLVPVAGLSQKDLGLDELKAMGFRAVKVHPRLTGLEIKSERFGQVLRESESTGLPVFLCTYQFGGPGEQPHTDPFYELARQLAKAPGAKVVLLHGGAVEILKYAELARAHPNLLLDLSFTLMKYEGSSIDLDLAFLLRRFDRRLCLGVDFPDFGHGEVRRRFETLTSGIEPEKAHNVGFGNLARFLGLGDA
jgi:hypothetical protein